MWNIIKKKIYFENKNKAIFYSKRFTKHEKYRHYYRFDYIHNKSALGNNESVHIFFFIKMCKNLI